MTDIRNILVRFATSYDDYRVAEDPFSVPSNLGRNGLSDVINHLLELERTIPFDFAINGRLIRSPLGKFVSHYQISTENIILVNYFPAMTASNESNSTEGDSWIGCIQVLANSVGFCGCYDGKVMVFDSTNLNVDLTVTSHDESIQCITVWRNNESFSTFATGSKDTTIKVWEYNHTANTASLLHTLSGHVNSVQSLAQISLPNTEENILLSGDWSGNLSGWKLNHSHVPEDSEEKMQKHSKKKRRGNEGQVAESPKDIKPFFTQKAHNQSISSIFSTASFASVFTSSWDHSFKQWDLDKLDSVLTVNCSKVITSLDCNESDRIATSHPDGKIRVWDIKSREVSNVPTLSLGRTNNWISQVKWMPGNENVLASVDYAGIVNVWDLRTSVPLTSLEIHDGKGLALTWCQDSDGDHKFSILSGGSDCCLKSFSVTCP